MGTYSLATIIKTFQKKNIELFTLEDFARLFKVQKQNTVYKKIQRLKKKGIVKKLIKGKYQYLLKDISKLDLQKFKIANFLYQPSYISLESALSFYGIITGFPQVITSISVKKTKTYVIENQEYCYTQISADLFWGYEREQEVLIADKEKSLIDYLYLVFKGQKSFDKQEFDLSLISKSKYKAYLKQIKNKQFRKSILKLNI